MVEIIDILQQYLCSSNDFEIISKTHFNSDFYLVRNRSTLELYLGKALDRENEDIFVKINDGRDLVPIELIIGSQLYYPSIIKYIGYCQKGIDYETRPTLIMEDTKNGPLSLIIDSQDITKFQDILNLLIYNIVSGMAYLHAQDILHCNLNTFNIFIDVNYNPKICNFENSVQLSQNQKYCIKKNAGPYTAPEVIKNQKYSKASEVYSFGVVLYEILTFQYPFNNLNLCETIEKVGTGYRPRIDDSISPFYRELINKCWSQNPDDRPTFGQILIQLQKQNKYNREIDIHRNEQVLHNTMTDAFMMADQYDDISAEFDNAEHIMRNDTEGQRVIYNEPLEIDKNLQNLRNSLNEDSIEISEELQKKLDSLNERSNPLCESNYEIMNLIEQGNIGEIYKVKNRQTKKIQIAKVMYKDHCDYPREQREKIDASMKEMINLDHPSIVKYIKFSQYGISEEFRPMILTDYIKNGSLSEALKKEKASLKKPLLNDTQKLIIIYGIACGMSYLHSHGILHHDLKASSILLDENLYPKINNYGMSELFDSSEKIAKIVMTHPFTSPEVLLNGPEMFSMKSDVYSFALLVYEILTNKKPFCKVGKGQLFEKIMNSYRPDLSRSVPDQYRDLIEKCWSQNPDERPTFDQIVDSIERKDFFDDGNVSAPEFLRYSKHIGRTCTVGKVEEVGGKKKGRRRKGRKQTKNGQKKEAKNSHEEEDQKEKDREYDYEEEEEKAEEEQKSENEEQSIENEEQKAEDEKQSTEIKGQKEEDEGFQIPGVKTFDLENFESDDCVIGNGAFAVVYKITHKLSGAIYAAKVQIQIKESIKTVSLVPTKKNWKLVDIAIDVMREVRNHSLFHTKTITNFHGYNSNGIKKACNPTIVLDFHPNSDLEKLLEIERDPDVCFAFEGWDDTQRMIVAYGVAHALSFIHSLGIIHRDVNPRNVLLDEYLFPKLADFGISKKITGEDDDILQLIEKRDKIHYEDDDDDEGEDMFYFKGTVRFSAPEILSNGNYSKKGDVYSYGLLLFEIFNKRLPFSFCGSDEAIRYEVVKNDKKPPINRKLKLCLKNLIESCWKRDPNDRPSFDVILEKLRSDEFIDSSIDKERFNGYVEFINNDQPKPSEIFKVYSLNLMNRQ